MIPLVFHIWQSYLFCLQMTMKFFIVIHKCLTFGHNICSLGNVIMLWQCNVIMLHNVFIF